MDKSLHNVYHSVVKQIQIKPIFFKGFQIKHPKASDLKLNDILKTLSMSIQLFEL